MEILMSKILIRDVRVILTAPDNINLIVIKVETSEPGLYGLGCGTFAYREKAVACIVEDYLKPLLVGRQVSDIEDLWQLMYQNAYWRNDAVSANAISGVDMALWDIKGKMAGMPLYDLLGGKARDGVAVYRHASGESLEELVEEMEKYQEEGIDHIRVQWGFYGGTSKHMHHPRKRKDGQYYDPKNYMRRALEMFDYVRKHTSEHIELLHDVHERLTPIDAVSFAKSVEAYKLFYLEDVLSPKQAHWLTQIRQQTSVPIALGELFTNPTEWDPLIINKLIDFIRVHISMIGGITPARKLAVFGEQMGIQTAWHGPGDVSPVGHAVNIQLDTNARNFGIQEWCGISPLQREMFPGTPELIDGYVYANEKPGLGIDLDEALAAKYPAKTSVTEWTQTRLPDGTLFTP